MASPNNPASSAELIRKHSKARVLFAHPVGALERRIGSKREIHRDDVIESMIRQYC